MTDKELNKILKEFKTVRVEMLDEGAKRLFYAIMKIADERDELLKENQRLNNVLNELKEWFKEFHKYHSRLKWNEEDYIEFIEHLENELKESDK